METENLPSFLGTENLDTVKGWRGYPARPPKGHAEPPWDFYFEALNAIGKRWKDLDPEPGTKEFRELLETFFVTPWEKWVDGFEKWKRGSQYWGPGPGAAWASLVYCLTDKSKINEYVISDGIRAALRNVERRDEGLKGSVLPVAVVKLKTIEPTRVVLKTIIKEIKRRRWPESYEDVLVAAWENPKRMRKKKGRRVFAGGDEKLADLSEWSYKTVKRARWAFMRAGIWNIQRRWSWKRKRCYELFMCRSMSQVMHFKKKVGAIGKTKH